MANRTQIYPGQQTQVGDGGERGRMTVLPCVMLEDIIASGAAAFTVGMLGGTEPVTELPTTMKKALISGD